MNALSEARSVAVIAAMVPEVRPFVRSLSLAPVGPRVDRTWAGQALDREIVAAATSMGTAAATEATRRLLRDFRVDWVIAIGICGAIDPELAIGELIVPEKTYDESTDTWASPTPLGDAVATGRLLTTNELYADEELPALRERGFVAVDMETGAIGAECERRGVPWSVFRAVSDRAGDPQVDADLVRMAKPDGTANIPAVVRYVATHPSRIAKMGELARGMRAAVQASTDAARAAITATPHRS